MLFTDVVLPAGMSGVDLAAALRKRRPNLPALYTSGYASGKASGAIANDMRVLAKPWSADALAEAIRSTIDAIDATEEPLE